MLDPHSMPTSIDAQKAEVLGDCYQLLLILAETEAQSASDQKPAENEPTCARPSITSITPGSSGALPGVPPAAGALPEAARQAGRGGAGRAGGRALRSTKSSTIS